MSDDRSAALLVRVWLDGETEQFRARVMAVGPETPESDRTVAVSSSPSEVIDAVSRWLDELVRHGLTTD